MGIQLRKKTDSFMLKKWQVRCVGSSQTKGKNCERRRDEGGEQKSQ